MLVPSIDIMGGKVVQLRQGKDLVLSVDRDPVDVARELNRYGEIAVIDLDAAMNKGENKEVIERICKIADARVGGGIRDVESARRLLKAGAKKLIIGTAATPELLCELPTDLLLVALDQKKGKVVDQGWQNDTGENYEARAERLAKYCSGFLLTFVEQEGGLGGMPPVEAAHNLAKKLNKSLTVAGGIGSGAEVVELSKKGLDVQVGMALYKGLMNPADTVIESLKFGADGLLPTIVQDEAGNVLMVAYSNAESLKVALTEGRGVYYSRSRQELWRKGDTSGSIQHLISCRTDCDRDTVLFKVRQTEGACHTGSYSCFDGASKMPPFTINELFETLKERKNSNSEKSYSSKLFKDRKLLTRKIIEECGEVVTFSSKENLRYEIADAIYHMSVLAVDEGIDWNDIVLELGGRRK